MTLLGPRLEVTLGDASAVRILHIHSGNLFGGVESLLCTLARTGPAEGVDSEFALCFPGRLWDELAVAGAGVHDLGDTRVRRPWTIVRARRRLGRVLRARAVDAVLVHSAWTHLLFSTVARSAGRPVVFNLHDVATGRHWTQALARRVVPDFVVANSEFTRRTVPALWTDVATATVHPAVAAPRVEPEARRAVRAELGASADEVVIVHAARLERWKGQGLLLEALGRLERSDRWSAWIAGGPQRAHERAYHAELQRQAAALGLGARVRFLGERQDVPRLLAAADILCQPNTAPEPFGIAFVEALHAGLAVVSTRMGAAVELLDAGAGLLVEPSAEAVAGALATLIRDGALRERLGAGGPSRARALCDPRDRLRELCAVVARVSAPGDPDASPGSRA